MKRYLFILLSCFLMIACSQDNDVEVKENDQPYFDVDFKFTPKTNSKRYYFDFMIRVLNEKEKRVFQANQIFSNYPNLTLPEGNVNYLLINSKNNTEQSKCIVFLHVIDYYPDNSFKQEFFLTDTFLLSKQNKLLQFTYPEDTLNILHRKIYF